MTIQSCPTCKSRNKKCPGRPKCRCSRCLESRNLNSKLKSVERRHSNISKLKIEDFLSLTDRKIEAVFNSELGFPVIVSSPDLERHLGYDRFEEKDKNIQLQIIERALEHPDNIYYEDRSDNTISYSVYRDSDGAMYMVGVKFDKRKSVGFFETLMRLKEIRKKHLKQRKLK